MNKFRYAIEFLFILLSTVSSRADTRFISSRNGLSNSSINCIYKDSDDLMWFGTWDGLNRYDGSDFEIYRSSLDGNSISSSIIRRIMEDSDRNLWVTTDRGIDRYDRHSDTFTRFFTDIKGITGENSFHLALGPNGELIAAISWQGLYRYQAAEDRFTPVCDFSGQINGLYFDSFANIWIKSGEQMLLFTKSTDGSIFYTGVLTDTRVEFAEVNESSIWLRESGSRVLKEIDIQKRSVKRTLTLPGQVKRITCIDDSSDTILIGTDCGLFEYSDGTYTRLLENIQIFSLLKDCEQIVWVGTDMSGVALISNMETPFRSISGKDIPSFANCAVRTFYEEMPGRLWVGTKGNGIIQMDLSDPSKSRKISTQNGLNDDNVYSLFEGDEVIWAGTDGKGIEYIDKGNQAIHALQLPDSLTVASVYSILQTQRNVIWVGTSGYGLFRIKIDRTRRPYRAISVMHFTKESGDLRSNIVYALALDDDRHVWAGTRGGGLERFSLDGTREPVKLPDEINNAINDIICLTIDSDGNLLIGTSLGLYCRDGEGDVYKIGSKHIDDTSIHGITEDAEKILWVSTNNGLIRIDRSQTPVSETRFSQEDGLQGNEFSDGACYISPFSDCTYFGGNNGFSFFTPQDTRRSKTFPKLHLDGVYLSNARSNDAVQEKNGIQEIVIKPGISAFTVKFATLDFLASDRCELAYRLKGQSKEWNYVGTSKSIAFSNLHHGTYTLEVRHTNSDKVWSDDIFSIRLDVLPYWYQKWWAQLAFWALGLLVFAVLVWSVLSRRKEKLQIMEKEDEKNKLIDIHEAKLKFFTNIAHEFSNSLTLIYGPCKELQRINQIPPESQKYLNYIESNSSRMLNLIQQIISFRKAETGHLSLNPEKVNILDTLSSTEAYFKGNLEKNSIQLLSEWPEEEIIWGTDRDCFEKITFNLLSNATKYTPAGGTIRVRCSVTAENTLKVSITNYGIGIPEEKREAIFDRFEVLDRFENDIRKGKISNGIGLSMCKNLVELMQGKIWIDSDGQSYTSFCFELPELQIPEKIGADTAVVLPEETADTPEEETAPANVPDETRPASEKRILIVDDDPAIRSFIRNLLSDRYVTAEASDGKQALSVLEKNLPDLVISDAIMPEMDGFQLLRAIRENKMYRHIPVVMLTSENSEDNRKLALDKGADAFVGKPFDPNMLYSVIANLLGRDSAIIEYSNSALSAMDRFLGEEISKEDKALFSKVTEVIDKNMDSDKLCIDFIAEKVSVSKMQLYRKFKSCLNTTPVEYIRTLRMEKAEKLLKTTTMTVQQIMYACGFNSKTYFYREFAKNYGVTPKQYRENGN